MQHVLRCVPDKANLRRLSPPPPPFSHPMPYRVAPQGSTGPKERECGSEYLYCPEGSANAINVSVGWYSTGGGQLTRSGQAECLAATGGGGRTPPSGLEIIERCPDNTVAWNNDTTVEGMG